MRDEMMARLGLPAKRLGKISNQSVFLKILCDLDKLKGKR